MSRRVAIWRNAWLAPSETFVRDQVAALRTFEPVTIALRRLREPLVEPDLAVLGPGRLTEVATEAVGSLGHQRRIAALLRERDVDLVHAHFAPDGMAAAPVARLLDRPLVTTGHGYDVTRLPRLPLLAGLEYRRRLRGLYRSADALVAVSRFIADAMLALGAPADRLHVLPIGIDTRPGAEVSPYPGRRGVTYVGRLVEKKGVLDVVAAWSALPRELKEQHPLRIVGTGPLADRLAIAREQVEGPLELLGYQPSATVAALLDRTAVYCQPSRTAPDGDAEGLGMVFLEAALHAAPVVAYAHGGVPEAVLDGRTGLLAPEADLDELRGRLQRLLEHPSEAEALGAAGRRRVLADFDIVGRTAALEELYAVLAR